MPEVQLSETADYDWDSLCEEQGLLFYSTPWAELLHRSMGAIPVFAREGSTRFVLPVFVRGPFRIAYAGFPVAPPLDLNRLNQIRTAGKLLDKPHRPQIIRYSPKAFRHQPCTLQEELHPSACSVESAISDLQAWNIANVSASVRRNIRKASKSGLQIRTAETSMDANYMYHSYRETVLRNQGQLRYSRSYFRALVELSETNSALDCRIAEQDTSPAGYIITARHGATTYYLHGAYTPVYQNLRPMDLLFATAIEQAQSWGSAQFNFMASPTSQPSLVRYKEKWGAESRTQNTFDLVLSRPHALLFSLVQKTMAHTPDALLRMFQ